MEQVSTRSWRYMRPDEKIRRVTAFLVLCVVSLVMITPFFWMLSTSLKRNIDAYKMPPDWIPNPVIWTKYVEIWEKAPLLRGVLNSATVAVTVIVLGTFFTSLAAYAFSKMRFPGKEAIFLTLLATMMIPFPVVMIPQYVAFSKIGWIDSLLPLIVPPMLGNVFMMFFIRQYMSGLSNEIIEAAKIDGAGHFGIYARIMLPMIKPALAAQSILWFMNIWNDYLGPLIYINTPEKQTIQLMIAGFNAFYAIQNDFPLIMAASFVSMIPTLTVFLIFQRHFVSSLQFTGIKA